MSDGDLSILDQDQEVDLSIFGKRIVSNLRLITVLGFLGAIVMLIFTLVSAPVYRAKASLLLVQTSPTPSSAAQAAMALTGVNNGQGQQAGMLQGILASESALKSIGKETGLKRKELEKNFLVDFDNKQSIITLSYESKDKNVNLAVLKAAINTLEVLNRSIGFSAAARQANLLERTVATAEQELKKAEENLKAFASKASTGADPRSAESISFYLRQLRQAENELGAIETSMSNLKQTLVRSSSLNMLPSGVAQLRPWQEKLAELQYELQVAQQKLGPEAPEILSLERSIAVTKRQLEEVTRKYLTSVNQNIEPKLAELEAKRLAADYQVKYWRKLQESVPTETLGLTRLGRIVAQKSTTLTQLQEQYTRAKIESEVDRVRWSQLDAPFLEEEPTNKSKAKPCILGFIAGSFFGCLLALRKR